MSPIYPVSSSNVQDIWTDNEDVYGSDLFVRFRPKPGSKPYARTWIYPGGGYLLQQMLQAPSKGQYVHYVLKPLFPNAYEV